MRGNLINVQQAVFGHFRRTLISGLLLLIPVAMTYLIVRFLFDLVDGVLRPWMQWVLAQFGIDWSLPGPGVIAGVVLLYAVGLIAAFSVGRLAVDRTRAMLLRVPFVGTIYSATRQLTESFSGTSATGFKRVVLVEFPKDHTWSLGFLTGLTETGGTKRLLMAYVPTAPLPNSGFVVFVSPEDVLDTDLSVPDAMQLVFSGGIVSPASINTREVDVEELEREIERLKAPDYAVANKVKEGLTARAVRATKLSSNKLSKTSARAIRSAREAGYESSSMARDAMIGAVHIVDEVGESTSLQFKNTMIGLVAGVKDATGSTTNVIRDAAVGAIYGTRDCENRSTAAQGVAEGAIHAAPSIGVTTDQAIAQVSQGILEGLRQTDGDVVLGIKPTMKGIITAVVETKGDITGATHRAAHELIANAAKVNHHLLDAIAREVVESVLETTRELYLETNEIASSARAGAIEAAYQVSQSVGDSVRSAVTGAARASNPPKG